ncbi:hypothetical protein EK21DRAFT_49380, partial [Setomelanomma holmii]
TGPHLWDEQLDLDMNRTLRAYDLVCNYAYDCPRGVRWSEEDIQLVKHTGAHLHDDVRVLKAWKRTVCELGDTDLDMMRKITQDVESVREQVKNAQRVIRETE